jgi:hypothetical protein
LLGLAGVVFVLLVIAFSTVPSADLRWAAIRVHRAGGMASLAFRSLAGGRTFHHVVMMLVFLTCWNARGNLWLWTLPC